MASQFERQPDDVMGRGNVTYVYNPVTQHSYPRKANSSGIPGIAVSNTAGTLTALLGDTNGILGQRVNLIFYPGGQAAASGMVTSGTRTGSGTVTTGGTANQTYWGSNITYQPLEIGKVDGVASGGYFSGQVTIGLKTSAATADAKVTAAMGNTPAGTTGGSVVLALSGTVIACSTAEIYQTYDIPHLITNTAFNSVPVDFILGVQSNLAGTSVIARIMESSYIAFDVIPGT